MATVLVVDDELEVRRSICAVLARAGHRVVEAANGMEGEQHAARLPIDLVIMDIVMPEQEGIETIRRMREADPSLKILAISGGGRARNMDFLEIARKFGAIETMAKPFEPKELVRLVNRLVQSNSENLT